MEDLTEVPMEQAMPSPDGEGVDRSETDEVSAGETKEGLPDESESVMEEATVSEAGGEDSPADYNGNEVPEDGPPEIDPAVYAGWQELAKAHPEVVGKPLPDDIMKVCVESGLPPLRVYESMMLKKQGEQIAALQQEIATLRQNAEAAQRAPVTAASLGGNEGNDAEDMFRKGFDYLVNHS